MTRYLVQVYLESFFTTTSGEKFGKGEFYIKCNGKRYPNRGKLHLNAGQTFDPQPNPTLYTAVIDDKEKFINFKLQVVEADPGRNDIFIEHEMKIAIKPYNQSYELFDKSQRCTLKFVVQVVPTY